MDIDKTRRGVHERQVEQRLKEVLEGLHSEGENLVDCLWSDLSNGAMELRASAYGLIASLANRIWFAAKVCEHASLFARLIDAKGEVHAELSKSRYACRRSGG